MKEYPWDNLYCQDFSEIPAEKKNNEENNDDFNLEEIFAKINEAIKTGETTSSITFFQDEEGRIYGISEKGYGFKEVDTRTFEERIQEALSGDYDSSYGKVKKKTPQKF